MNEKRCFLKLHDFTMFYDFIYTFFRWWFDRKKYADYWQNVFGDDKIFKSKALLIAEKKAVARAAAAMERQKAGLDLIELLQKEAADQAADEDSS